MAGVVLVVRGGDVSFFHLISLAVKSADGDKVEAGKECQACEAFLSVRADAGFREPAFGVAVRLIWAVFMHLMSFCRWSSPQPHAVATTSGQVWTYKYPHLYDKISLAADVCYVTALERDLHVLQNRALPTCNSQLLGSPERDLITETRLALGGGQLPIPNQACQSVGGSGVYRRAGMASVTLTTMRGLLFPAAISRPTAFLLLSTPLLPGLRTTGRYDRDFRYCPGAPQPGTETSGSGVSTSKHARTFATTRTI